MTTLSGLPAPDPVRMLAEALAQIVRDAVAQAAPAERDIRLLSIDGVAERLAVSPDTVRRMLDDGDLPFVRVRDRRRVRLDDLRAYLDREGDAQRVA